MKQQVLERAQTVVEDVLREQSTSVPLELLSMRPEVDGDGDEFIWVRLIHDREPGMLGSELQLGLMRRLRSRLEEVDVDAFPVLSFVARSDPEDAE